MWPGSDSDAEIRLDDSDGPSRRFGCGPGALVARPGSESETLTGRTRDSEGTRTIPAGGSACQALTPSVRVRLGDSDCIMA
jgi:hypothetical protein